MTSSSLSSIPFVVAACIILMTTTTTTSSSSTPPPPTTTTVSADVIVHKFLSLEADDLLFAESSPVTDAVTATPEDCGLACVRDPLCWGFTFMAAAPAPTPAPTACWQLFSAVSPATSRTTAAPRQARSYRLAGRNATCSQNGMTVETPLSTSGSYSYSQYLPPPAVNISSLTKLCFTVQMCNDAHLLLARDSGSWQQGTDMYEVVIGGWGNGKSVVRLQGQGSPVVTLNHPTSSRPLSCDQPRPFYVSWGNTGDVLEVGTRQGLKEDAFLEYRNPQPFQIQHVFAAGWNSPGAWVLGPCCL